MGPLYHYSGSDVIAWICIFTPYITYYYMNVITHSYMFSGVSSKRPFKVGQAWMNTSHTLCNFNSIKNVYFHANIMQQPLQIPMHNQCQWRKYIGHGTDALWWYISIQSGRNTDIPIIITAIFHKKSIKINYNTQTIYRRTPVQLQYKFYIWTLRSRYKNMYIIYSNRQQQDYWTE